MEARQAELTEELEQPRAAGPDQWGQVGGAAGTEGGGTNTCPLLTLLISLTAVLEISRVMYQ